jgi:hypothetical protein
MYVQCMRLSVYVCMYLQVYVCVHLTQLLHSKTQNEELDVVAAHEEKKKMQIEEDESCMAQEEKERTEVSMMRGDVCQYNDM